MHGVWLSIGPPKHGHCVLKKSMVTVGNHDRRYKERRSTADLSYGPKPSCSLLRHSGRSRENRMEELWGRSESLHARSSCVVAISDELG
jgi:hypothetical protein